MEQIKNDKLTVTVSKHGAELQSIKDANGKEYLWQADPKFWDRHSPILFPIVCGLWEDKYRVNGKEYKLGRHGFARDTDFKLIAQGDNQLVYGLNDSTETLKDYPYHFNLAVSYKITENKIKVIWHVENTDNKEIYFQIGGHPAFNVPDLKQGEPLAGTLKFDDEEPSRLYGNVGGCITPGYHKVKTEGGLYKFTQDDFKDDAVIFDHSQLKKISIINKEGKPEVTLDIKTPAVGIWSPYGKDAHFVCIEPWYGIHDWAEYDGEFKDKYLMNKLLPGCSFMSEYTITIGE
ncbi:aldose 1-epimerase family protein [Segatella paludivivens]|uniref:aldose 1-epimerase family protein n=1 Tax=Segatella paludivivens TaxID=185294 RepID=UPI00035FEE51|nr:aldose 1-epimerase family protein [Segatella paludivivens]